MINQSGHCGAVLTRHRASDQTHAPILVTSLATAAMLVSGCSMPPRIVEREPETAADVARVGVAVVATAPFEVFVKSLKPAFEIDGDKALKLAGASTRQLEDSFTDSVQLLAKLAPERLSSERKSETSTDAAGTISTTSTVSRSATAGDVSKVSGPTVPADKLPESMSTSSGGGINPMLNYQMATALLQEVQLLNEYVSSAPKLAGHTAFVARLQLNVQPLGRNTPYDATVSMTFTPVGGEGAVVTAVPLLATDSLDITSAAVARRNVRSIGLALDLLRGGFGGAFDFGRRTEQLLSALGTEVNSELTVGRGKANNEIAVRIGAIDKGVDKHELVARSHMVTVLLLVPNKLRGDQSAPRVPTIEVSSRVIFEHARTAKSLKSHDARPMLTSFEAPFWAPPRMPAQQAVQAVLVGKKAPYGVEIVLRGGDSLHRRMFDVACLQTSGQGVCDGSGSPVFAELVETTNDRNGIRVAFGASFAAPVNKQAQIRFHGDSEKSPVFSHMCYRVADDWSDPHKGQCLPLSSVYQTSPPDPEPELDAAVKTTTQRVVATRDGHAILTLSVAMPQKKQLTPDAVEITIDGAGIAGVSELNAKSQCVAMTDVIRIVGDCIFNVALANAVPGRAITIGAVATQGKRTDKTYKSVDVGQAIKPIDVQLIAPVAPVAPVAPASTAMTRPGAIGANTSVETGK